MGTFSASEHGYNSASLRQLCLWMLYKFGHTTDAVINKITKIGHISDIWSVWPDWAICWTLGNFLKSLATNNLPKSSTLLGYFCKVVKIYHFSIEIIFRQLLWTFGDFSGHTVIWFTRYIRKTNVLHCLALIRSVTVFELFSCEQRCIGSRYPMEKTDSAWSRENQMSTYFLFVWSSINGCCCVFSLLIILLLALVHTAVGVPGSIGSKLVSGSMSISPASRSNVQYNPAGDTKSKIKTSSLEIGFLGKMDRLQYKWSRLAPALLCLKLALK